VTDEHTSIGERLRRQREERGLSVEQAAFQSKVPRTLLQALESDDYHLLPDALYLIRLLGDYAAFLRLDVEALQDEFRQAVRRPQRVSLAPPSQVLFHPVIPWKQVGWTVVAILAVLPLVFIALSLASKRAADRPDPGSASPAPPAISTGEGARTDGDAPEVAADALASAGGVSRGVAGGGEGARTVPPVIEPPIPAAPPPAPAGRAPQAGEARQVLLVRAQELTWLSVRSDDGAPREVLLPAGQVARFGAEERFRVTVGNAGGIAIWLNGLPISPLGRSGEVVRDLILPTASDGAGPRP
jgi:cytoskeleton protein RodZ